MKNQAQLDQMSLNELKMLSIDMIDRAGSGSPGICLAMAPVMYTLFTKCINISPKIPNYFNRDRVILSSSHIAPLYYAMLYIAGYDIKKEDLMNYKRILSNTPALPELNNPAGVDASCAFAGDGVGLSLGIELGREYIDSLLKKEDKKANILNFNTYCFLSDADIISGTAEESFSFIATKKLNNIIFLYDKNNMTSDGSSKDVLDIDVAKKFHSYGYYVDELKDSTNIRDIQRAIEAAKRSNRPSMLIFNTVIGKDSFNEGKQIMHSGTLSLDDANTLRRKYNIIFPPFEVSKDTFLHVQKEIKDRTTKIQTKWNEEFERLRGVNIASINNIIYTLQNRFTTIPFDSSNYKINDGYRETLKESNYKILNLAISKNDLSLVLNTADSLDTLVYLQNTTYFNETNKLGRNIRLGVRNLASPNIINGLNLMGIRPFIGSKLVYADDMLKGIKMSALMNLGVTYIFTHDSVYNSIDGISRIPTSEISFLRHIPNLTVYRPADINEMMGTYETILEENKPAAIVVGTNSVPKLPGSNAKNVEKGAYIIKSERNRLDGIIMSSGEEVVSAMQIAYDLEKEGIDIRVISVPSLDKFMEQGENYQKELIPYDIKRCVIEASNDTKWYKYLDAKVDNNLININDFAYGGVPIEVLQKMGYDYDSLNLKVREILK